METRFPLGQCVITAHAQQTLHADDVKRGLHRHVSGDWGDLCQEDRQANEEGLAQGLRLFSRYTDRFGTAFYIITEADRSATTVLLPDDY